MGGIRKRLGLALSTLKAEHTDHSKSQPSAHGRAASPPSDSKLSASWINHSSSEATSGRKGRRHWLPQQNGWHHAQHLNLTPGNPLKQGRCWIPVQRLALSQTGNLGESPPLSDLMRDQSRWRQPSQAKGLEGKNAGQHLAQCSSAPSNTGDREERAG